MSKIILIILMSNFLFANIAKISTIIGDASIQRGQNTFNAKVGSILENKDIIKTSNNSKLQVIFSDNTIITIGKSSSLNIADYLYDKQNNKNSRTDFRLFRGSFKVITGKIGKLNKKRFKLKTKSASIGIRGTILLGNQELIACIKGGITVESNGKIVDVDANEVTVIQKDGKPSDAVSITPENMEALESDTNTQEEDTQNSESNTDTNNIESIDNVVENTVENSNNKTLESTTKTLKGKHLGIRISDTPSLNYERSVTDFVLSLINGNLSANGEALVKKNSEANTTYQYSFSQNGLNFDTNGIYNGFSKVASGVNYNYVKPDGNVIGGAYSLYADNLGEFFIGLNSSFDPVSSSSNLSEMFVAGTQTDLSKLDNNKIYMYKRFANLSANYLGDELVSKDAVLQRDSDKNYYVFYNPKLNSVSALSENFHEKGASEFVVGRNNSINVRTNSYNDASLILETPTKNVNLDVDFYGSQGQGISTSKIDTPVQNGSEKLKQIGAGVLDKNFNESVKSHNIHLTGFSAINDSSNFNASPADLNLFVNSNLGTISGSTTHQSISFSGQVYNSNAFYISDDFFGVEVTSKPGYITDSGFLVAVPDGGFDSNDNPIMLDDNSSWGYWTSSYSDRTIHSSTPWVAGEAVNTANMDTLLEYAGADSKTYNFEGKVLGNVKLSSGEIQNIIVDDTNSANLTFRFASSANNFDAKFKFGVASNDTWDIDVSGNNVNNTGFTYSENNTTIGGKFYGDSDIKSVGGTLIDTNNGHRVNAVFKATKTGN